MLKDSFFTVSGLVPVESDMIPTRQKIIFRVALDPSHSIYQGHFPGNPVVPGVCQAEMIRELLGIWVNGEVRLLKADNIKYLSMINPFENGNIQVDIDRKEKGNGMIDVSAMITAEAVVFLKFKGTFTTEG
jgi:3-hydroxyacyl-[acyl-carrier-protein] dehydratase